MAATAQNFSMYAGDTAVIGVTLKGADGDPLDMTGVVLYWVMGPVQGPPTLTKTSTNPFEIAAADGAADIYLSPADTKFLKGEHRHELRLVDSAGAVETVLVGTVTIHQSAVQPVVGIRLVAHAG